MKLYKYIYIYIYIYIKYTEKGTIFLIMSNETGSRTAFEMKWVKIKLTSPKSSSNMHSTCCSAGKLIVAFNDQGSKEREKNK